MLHYFCFSKDLKILNYNEVFCEWRCAVVVKDLKIFVLGWRNRNAIYNL